MRVTREDILHRPSGRAFRSLDVRESVVSALHSDTASDTDSSWFSDASRWVSLVRWPIKSGILRILLPTRISQDGIYKCTNHEDEDLLTMMIATRFFDSIVGNNRFQSIFGSIVHNSMIMT